jgi:putative NAD(P)H nitroreductase
MEFEKLVKERRSAKNFVESEKISKKELDEIFELVRFAPSCFNLQHTKYIVITDPEKKEQLKESGICG